MKYVLDSNTISGILNGNQNIENKAHDVILKEGEIFLDCICYYEVKRGLLYSNLKSKLKKFEYLCQIFPLVLLNSINILDEAIKIYIQLRKIGRLPDENGLDILIAAATKYNNAILVTNNEKDFENIQGLVIENWAT